MEHNVCKKTVALDLEQAVTSVFGSIFFDIVKVTADASQLITELFPNLLRCFFAAFVELEEPPAGDLPVRPGLFGPAVHGSMYFPVTVEDALCPSPGLVA